MFWLSAHDPILTAIVRNLAEVAIATKLRPLKPVLTFCKLGHKAVHKQGYGIETP